MCTHQAAAAALLEAGARAALQICDLLPDTARTDCGESLYWSLLNRGDAQGAAAFCLEHLPRERHSYCVKTAAEVLAESDPDEGVQMCRAIRVDGPDDQWQQDACFSNIACMLARSDAAQAEQLCALISGETDITEQNCLSCIASERAQPTPLVAPEPTGRAEPTDPGHSVSPLPSPTGVP
jgi:hypothetical protein